MHDGVLVVDKPAGWTSHDVVARTRRLAGTRKVGHAGTLDPMATGVLVLGVGRATRLLTYLVGADKEYDATIRLGVATTTDDAEGEVVARTDASGVTEQLVHDGIAALTGDIEQVPTAVSAVKIDGQRAYARVRAGERVTLAARPVTVHRFEAHDIRRATDADVPVLDVDVTVHCSSGTYVRALARDLGERLGVGGHLTALRRTRVDGYGLDVARTLDELAEELSIIPMPEAARAIFPVRTLTTDQARALSYGQRIDTDPQASTGTAQAPVAAYAPDGTLVALIADEAGRSRPVLVLAPA